MIVPHTPDVSQACETHLEPQAKAVMLLVVTLVLRDAVNAVQK